MFDFNKYLFRISLFPVVFLAHNCSKNYNIHITSNVFKEEIDFVFDAFELNNYTFITVGESSSNNFDVPENKGFTDLLLFKIH
jgi:hypothetical protein